MTSSEKLQIILDLSGLTQEKLAQKLQVSFPTLNSWIRRRSEPREKKKRGIEALYSQMTGITEKALSSLEAKKTIIQAKQKRSKDILGFIRQRTDVFEQLCLSLTYNTNRIEGSTLTEPQTAAILFDNVALPNKTMVEHLEVKNHQAAFTHLLGVLRLGKRIDERLILKLHAILLNGIQSDAGLYRRHGVRIVGSHVPTSNYLKVPLLMKSLMKEINAHREDIFSHVSHVHSSFEQIHPFSDGNGRIGRLLIQAMLLRSNYPPAVILQKKKRYYLSALNKSQIKADIQDLEEFLCDAILLGFKIIEA